MRFRAIALATCVVALSACGSADGGSTAATTTGSAPSAEAGAATSRVRPASNVRAIARGLDVPWSIVFLPSGDALVSERSGRIVRIVRGSHRVRPVMRVPGVVAEGEGGLLGLAVSPHYDRDRLIYAYLTTATDNRIVRFRLGGRPTTVLSGLDKGAIHNGGRIGFGPDGKLYAGVGETGNTALAQDRASQNGKILRMEPDGGVPRDNPFPGSRIWSLGHRNVQGLAWDRAGRLWATEFGQNERDEVNLIRKGGNYGWPIVEGRGSTDGGRFVNPLVTWPTSEASPSGAAIAGGRLYVAGLRGERLWEIPLNGARTGRPRALLSGRFGRLRAVTVAPDGALWVSTSNRDGRGRIRDGDDRILRVPVR